MNTSKTQSVRYCFTHTPVQPEDITCVHAALKQVHPQKLLEVLLENQLAWKMDPRLLTGAAQRHLLSKTSSALQLMYNIEPEPLVNPHQVIIPLQTFSYEGSRGLLRRSIRASILNLMHASSAQSTTLDYALSIPAFLQHTCHAHKASASEQNSGTLERIDQFLSKPWSQVLGCALWLPSGLTEYERYAELAHIFWVMAYGGFAEAIFEMKASVLTPSANLEQATQVMNTFYEEQELKMARISELMNFNSNIDALCAAPALKRMAS